MRIILTEFYSLMYKWSGARLLSYITGLVYIAILNFIIVNGLVLLLQGWLGIVAKLAPFFRFPIHIVTFGLIFGLTYWLTPTLQTVAKDAKKISRHTTIAMYTLFGILLFAYKVLGDKIFISMP